MGLMSVADACLELQVSRKTLSTNRRGRWGPLRPLPKSAKRS